MQHTVSGEEGNGGTLCTGTTSTTDTMDVILRVVGVVVVEDVSDVTDIFAKKTNVSNLQSQGIDLIQQQEAIPCRVACSGERCLVMILRVAGQTGQSKLDARARTRTKSHPESLAMEEIQ